MYSFAGQTISLFLKYRENAAIASELCGQFVTEGDLTTSAIINEKEMIKEPRRPSDCVICIPTFRFMFAG